MQVLDDFQPFHTRRFPMNKMMVSIAAAVCLMCASTASFANEMGKMASEMKGEMKGDMKAATDPMKAKPDAMKGEMKAKTDSMKATKDAMKDDMKGAKDAMKGDMKGAMGY
jgi:hypothetical protein